MDSGGEIPEVPARPDERDRPRVGVDEWVAGVEGRREERRGVAGALARAWERTPGWAQLGAFVALAATMPFWTNDADLFDYGIFTLLFALLGLGLNVVVGYAGLLDLGYVAFFGFGAYGYALLSSEQYGLHWPTEASIPLVVVLTALAGLLLGIPSRRLLGDYLAIVTLFFGQAFVFFVNSSNPTVHGKGLTGGPNGIADTDPLSVFGRELSSLTHYFYYLLAVFALVVSALYLLSESRTGRAWRALREDPLAAEAMGIPVNRQKLLAFSIGAGVAGLVGCIFAALLTAVSPGNFDVAVLITLYAIVILGGLGSITGVILGAIVINVSFELLAAQNPQDRSRILFYGAIVLLLVLQMRPWRKLAAVLGGTLALGFVAVAVVDAVAPSWTGGNAIDGGRLTRFLENWALIPTGHPRFGEVAYVVLVAVIVVVAQLRGRWRTVALVPTLYLTALVWENILVDQPAVTRLILFGALLVGLMMARPQGLLGTPRVEIV
jgi:ABC-type branched-subunit amino acid transport system permease subunit